MLIRHVSWAGVEIFALKTINASLENVKALSANRIWANQGTSVPLGEIVSPENVDGKSALEKLMTSAPLQENAGQSK